MLVQFECRNCGATLEADAALGGGQAECGGCGTILLVPAPSIQSGTTVGGFHIERKLGAGGMGVVCIRRGRPR